MCGIAGIMSLNGPYTDLCAEIHGMTNRLKHRGPDDEGYVLWRSNGATSVACAGADTVMPLASTHPEIGRFGGQPWDAALGHRRFAIIDLTPKAHQPFMAPEGKLALAFNGEIYNYLELRSELEKEGVTFRTESDTEVLLRAFARWRENALERLNGIWGLAILDLSSGRLLLSRDRIGEKQVFFTWVDQRFYFASEIKSLLAIPRIWSQRKPSDFGVYSFLYHGIGQDTDGSLFEGIHQLPPGSFVWLERSGAFQVHRYWQPSRQRVAARDLPFQQAQSEFVDLLQDSIKLRLRADVPVLSELSGGLDSSSIVTLVAEHLRQRESRAKLRTFTVCYENPLYDESAFAQSVAEKAGADFHAIYPEATDFWGTAEEMIAIEEQPYHSPNLVTLRAMWSLMKEAGGRVVFDGAGGDELLAGYVYRYVGPFLYELLVTGKWRALVHEMAAWHQLSSVKVSELFARWAVMNTTGHLHRRHGTGVLKQKGFSFIKPPDALLREQLVELVDRLERGILSDLLEDSLVFFPLPMYLVQGDKLSMSVPIEVRLPYLDYRLVEYAFQLPIEYLLRNGWSKVILREAMRQRLPENVCWRRAKMGFPVPLHDWVKAGQEKTQFLFLNNPQSQRFIDPRTFLEIAAYLPAESIWRTLQVEMWMRSFDLC